jgi:hypothetical protein
LSFAPARNDLVEDVRSRTGFVNALLFLIRCVRWLVGWRIKASAGPFQP